MTDKTSDASTIREVAQQFGLADSTLRDWIESEVFGPADQIPTERRRGRKVMVFRREQIERLESFLRYRTWFSALPEGPMGQMHVIIGLLHQIEQGEYHAAIELLAEVEAFMEDTLAEVRVEIQRLHAKLHGDTQIDLTEGH